MSTTKKPTLNSEWDKIKDYKIFDSFEEFEALYNKRPGCKCFRKYTNYEWSKDNFFFGTYDELSEYYKTSLEVPFYLESHKNKKIGNITVLDFFIKIEKGSRSIYAKCKCDCGNDFEALYEAILKKNKRSCGCHNRKIKNTLFEFMPDLVEKEWDYDLNKDDPKKISVYSDEKYWWKDENGSYQMAPSDLIKKSMGTSLPEQVIYFYLKKIYPNITNRFKIRVENKLYEADIFIPEKSIAIEYDGLLWHKDKGEKEKVKYINLKSKGISLIRIREEGLSFDKNTADINIERKIKNINDFDSLCNMYNDLLRELSQLCNDPSLINGLIQSELIRNDIIEILKQYKIGFEENNISDSFLNEFWDYEKNENLRPRQISKIFEFPLYFKCKNNQSIQVAPRRMLERKQINKQCCFLGVCCPCENNKNINCELYDDYIYKKIKLYYVDKFYKRYNLEKFNLHNYKENYRKLILEDLDKLKNKTRYSVTMIEDFRFLIYNSSLVDLDFTNEVINIILEMNIKQDLLLEIFDGFNMQLQFNISEMSHIYENKNFIDFLFKNCDIEISDDCSHTRNIPSSLLWHSTFFFKNDVSVLSIEYVIEFLKHCLSEEKLFWFLKSCLNELIYRNCNNYYNLQVLDKLIALFNNKQFKGALSLYINTLKHKSELNRNFIKNIVFDAIKTLFKKGNAFTFKNYNYKFREDLDFCTILHDFLSHLIYVYKEENLDDKYYVGLISEIIIDNEDYFLSNSNAFVCLMYSIPSCEIGYNNTEYMRNNILIKIAHQCKCLNFLNYNIVDLLPYYNDFLYEIKFNCDNDIYFDHEWFEDEFLSNIKRLSNDDLENTLKVLKYIGSGRDNDLALHDTSYIVENLTKVKKAIKFELLEREK